MEDRYDIKITDADGTSLGFICDWAQGGAGLKIEPQDITRNSQLATKGNYGVRDSNDYMRIIQTDWSQGAGQKTYDRDEDSESAYEKSLCIDVGTKGEFKLAPHSQAKKDADTLPVIINHGVSGAQTLWASFTDASTAANRIAWSTDGVTWTVLSGTGPTSSPVDFATDGEVLYAVLSGGSIHTVTAVNSTTYSADASNANMTHAAFASGILYSAKGTATTDAVLGSWSSAATPVWTALTPAVASAINAAGVTFGLEASGNFVYWGVTENAVTRVYKAQYVDGAQDILLAVATFPTGFVGASMYAYLGTVYVGGHFDGEATATGIGAIYAIVDDQPVLLTDVGTDKTADNRVISMSAYERSLYFISNSQVWRWDLVNGGYSHWAGPLNSTPTLSYSGIDWTGQWDFDAAPGTGAEPDATVVVEGTTTVVYSGGYMTTSFSGGEAGWRRYTTSSAVAGIDDAVGTTLEVQVPALFADQDRSLTGLCAAIQGSAKQVAFYVYSVAGSTNYEVLLIDAGSRSGDTLASAYVSSSAHTFRLTLKDSYARLYVDNSEILAATVTSESTAQKLYLEVTRPTNAPTPDSVVIGRMRWTDDGAFDPRVVLSTTVSGAQLACWKDKVAAACSGFGVTRTSTTTYRATNAGEEEELPYLLASRSAGNMPTVDKYLHAIHVTLANVLPAYCDITVTGTIDGKGFTADEDTDLSTDTLLVFPIGIIGRNIQYQVNVTALPKTATLKFSTVLASSTLYVDGLLFTAHAATTTVANREFSIAGTDSQDADEFCDCVNDATYGAPGVTATNDSGTITLVSTNDTGLSVIVPSYISRIDESLVGVVDTPVITEVAVLFRPTPKQTKLYSYYLKVWDKVESNVSGQLWDVNPETACDFLEDNANTTVTVERKSSSYVGNIEAVQYVEASPSRMTSHRQGLYRVDIRRLT